MRKKGLKNTKSKSQKFRDKWLKKGYDLINMTSLCEVTIGESGWCNDFNEPDETCHHIQFKYRDEVIASYSPPNLYPIDDNKYLILMVNEDDPLGGEFIIYRKVKI